MRFPLPEPQLDPHPGDQLDDRKLREFMRGSHLNFEKLATLLPFGAKWLQDRSVQARKLRLDVMSGVGPSGSGLALTTSWAPWFNDTYTTPEGCPMAGIVFGAAQFHATVAQWDYVLAHVRCSQATVSYQPYDLRNCHGSEVYVRHANPRPWSYFELPENTVCNFEYMALASRAGNIIHSPGVNNNALLGVFWGL